MNFEITQILNTAMWPMARVFVCRFLSADVRITAKDVLTRRHGNFHYGKPFTEETEKQVLDYLDKSYIAGLSLLGGEPFEPCKPAGTASTLEKSKGKIPGEEYLVLYRL